MCHQTNLLAVELASWGLSVNDDKLHFCYLKQSRERGLTSTQGDLNFGASSQADFILNYFLSNFPSNYPFLPTLDGRLEQLMSPCCKPVKSLVLKPYF